MKLNENNCKSELILLFTLMMLDYILTYWGINVLKCIEEGNIFLVKLFELPFIYSFTLRLMHVSAIMVLSNIIYKHGEKYFKKFMVFALGINIIVMILHINWVVMYFTY